MKEEPGELSDAERDLFESLARQKQPPKFLEDRIVKELKREDLIDSPKIRRFSLFASLNPVVVSVLGLLFVGLAIGTAWYLGAFSTEERIPQFILLLRENPERNDKYLSDQEFDRLTAEYDKWTDINRQEGILLEGDNLEFDYRIVEMSEGESTDSNRTLKDGLIIGWFIIRAKDMETAVSVAKTCPHFKFGGRIEVREIEDPKLN